MSFLSVAPGAVCFLGSRSRERFGAGKRVSCVSVCVCVRVRTRTHTYVSSPQVSSLTEYSFLSSWVAVGDVDVSVPDRRALLQTHLLTVITGPH